MQIKISRTRKKNIHNDHNGNGKKKKKKKQEAKTQYCIIIMTKKLSPEDLRKMYLLSPFFVKLGFFTVEHCINSQTQLMR